MSCGGRPTSLIAWPRASAVECDGGRPNYCGKGLVRVPVCPPEIPRYFIAGVVWSPYILVTRPTTSTFTVFWEYTSWWTVCLLILLIVGMRCHFGQQIWPPVRHHPPHRWFAWAVQGDPRSVIGAPTPTPPTRCPGLLYDFKSKLSERFQVRITWPISAWVGAWSGFVPSVVY